MAFQGKNPFYSFLQEAAKEDLAIGAPAENCILDERVPSSREDEFLSFNGFELNTLDADSWFKQHVEYATVHVARARISGTFDSINRRNWFSPTPDSDVVRIESLRGMTSRARGFALTEDEISNLIAEYIEARDAGNSFDTFKQAQLNKWLQQVNSGSDRRPAFVAPFAEVEDLFDQPDWANRLRDVLGLGHLRPWGGGNAMSVLLMQYNLKRVYDAHIGNKAWAASPTVLDDVPRQMPNPCFFPAPASDSSNGYGYTVDLGLPWDSYRKEFLHGHISYSLADIRRIGEVTTDMLPSRIAEARREHLNLIATEFRHFNELPVKK